MVGGRYPPRCPGATGIASAASARNDAPERRRARRRERAPNGNLSGCQEGDFVGCRGATECHRSGRLIGGRKVGSGSG